LKGFGFLVDQPFFGLGRPDRLQELWYINGWLRDRLTPDYLAIGYVQGGLLAVNCADDVDSVWYLDDDDPRAVDGEDAAHICATALRRCADDIRQFWAALRTPPHLRELAVGLVESGQARAVRPALAGGALPANRRADWQDRPRSGKDPVADLFDLG
jgi:hypothetical protein